MEKKADAEAILRASLEDIDAEMHRLSKRRSAIELALAITISSSSGDILPAGEISTVAATSTGKPKGKEIVVAAVAAASAAGVEKIKWKKKIHGPLYHATYNDHRSHSLSTETKDIYKIMKQTYPGLEKKQVQEYRKRLDKAAAQEAAAHEPAAQEPAAQEPAAEV